MKRWDDYRNYDIVLNSGDGNRGLCESAERPAGLIVVRMINRTMAGNFERMLNLRNSHVNVIKHQYQSCVKSRKWLDKRVKFQYDKASLYD